MEVHHEASHLLTREWETTRCEGLKLGQAWMRGNGEEGALQATARLEGEMEWSDSR